TKNLKDMKLPTEGRIAIIVGPEGGISSEELERLSSAELVSLGANVLRTSTAGPAVLAALTLG
ncbi:MAG: 16S rRNA (uracil(1498)-N(3))-methyltransferase, partial [Actinobacteria bacterium]|nr:16S rRNA (uracil(1498)-N(3))-methyltransferase [Actinomycetota bacterium]